MPLLDVSRHVCKDLVTFCLSFFVLVCMVVSIQTNTSFMCADMQYDTHTNWRTGKERADTASAKSAVARTYNRV